MQRAQELLVDLQEAVQIIKSLKVTIGNKGHRCREQVEAQLQKLNELNLHTESWPEVLQIYLHLHCGLIYLCVVLVTGD
jgi:hypothetical protein